MYENHKPCECLISEELCIVVEELRDGKNTRLFHRHVRKSRLNRDDRVRVMHALIAHFAGFTPDNLVDLHLNNKGKKAAGLPRMQLRKVYSEPAVQRTYCQYFAGIDRTAWMDEVLIAERFRKGPAVTPAITPEGKRG